MTHTIYPPARLKRTARITGLLYLVIFVVAPFPFLIGRGGIIVEGDATTTATNLLASESVFRWSLVAETVVFLVEILLAGLLYSLLRPVSRSMSFSAALARAGEAIVQAVNLATSGIVLLLLGGAGYLAVFEADQLEALAMMFLDANGFLILVWGLFFALHLALLGVLVYRSGFWPRTIGVLLGLASVGYFAQSLGHLVAPQFDSFLAGLVIALAVPGELVFTIWLLWKGIDADRWEVRSLARGGL